MLSPQPRSNTPTRQEPALAMAGGTGSGVSTAGSGNGGSGVIACKAYQCCDYVGMSSQARVHSRCVLLQRLTMCHVLLVLSTLYGYVCLRLSRHQVAYMWVLLCFDAHLIILVLLLQAIYTALPTATQASRQVKGQAD